MIGLFPYPYSERVEDGRGKAVVNRFVGFVDVEVKELPKGGVAEVASWKESPSREWKVRSAGGQFFVPMATLANARHDGGKPVMRGDLPDFRRNSSLDFAPLFGFNSDDVRRADLARYCRFDESPPVIKAKGGGSLSSTREAEKARAREVYGKLAILGGEVHVEVDEPKLGFTDRPWFLSTYNLDPATRYAVFMQLGPAGYSDDTWQDHYGQFWNRDGRIKSPNDHDVYRLDQKDRLEAMIVERGYDPAACAIADLVVRDPTVLAFDSGRNATRRTLEHAVAAYAAPLGRFDVAGVELYLAVRDAASKMAAGSHVAADVWKRDLPALIAYVETVPGLTSAGLRESMAIAERHGLEFALPSPMSSRLP